MGKTFEEIADMPRWELLHWIAHYRQHPWGEEHEDMRSAMLCATIRMFSMAGGRFDPTPFYTHPRNRRPKRQTDEQQKQAMMQWVAMAGGTIKKG